MAFRSKTSTLTVSPDVVFEPHSELKNEEGTETLVLHIPDFKKDQLRVQVNNLGVLKVSGEKPLGEDGKRKTKFLKETKIPQGCDINDIRAKFTGGKLHVTMPIKAPTVLENQEEQPAATPMTALQSEVTQNPTANASVSDEQKLKASSSGNIKNPTFNASVSDEHKVKASSSGNGTMGTTTSKDESKDNMFGIGDCIARLQVKKKVDVNWGVAVVALVAIGAYVAYRYGSSSSSDTLPSHSED
ncbi:hypothetical protein RND81_13G069600 [Saponaria officinalis]|uniref:SHSP domain-containing protein n=1 Tax=Saponaria officinalis TaxID=3572 RepID=A0AAW1GUT9_SAPOF